MARLVKYQGAQNLSGLRNPQVVVDDAVGRATAGLGQHIQQSGENVGQLARLAHRRKQVVDDFERKRGLVEFQGSFAEKEREAVSGMEPGAIGYKDGMLKKFDEDSRAFIESLPASARPQAKVDVGNLRNKFEARFYDLEIKERTRYFLEGISRSTDELAKDIRANPRSYQETLDQGREMINGSGILPIEREAALQSWERMASLAWFDTLPASVRAEILPQPGGGDYFANIRQAESGGDDHAKNPNSSATGRYQFTSGTWKALRNKHPDLGLTADGRSDPVQQEKAIRAFTADNATILQSNGIETTHGNLYAAHFLGAGGAVQVLSASGETKMTSIVSPAVIKANPFLRSMKVADFQNWAASKAGGGRVVNIPDKYKDRMSHLTYADTLKLSDQAHSDLAAVATDIFKGFRERIVQEPEQPGLRDEIRADDYLDPGQKASLEKELNTELNRHSAKREAIAFGNSPLQGNPFDPEDRKKANNWYDVQRENGIGPDEAAEANLAKGVAPKGYLTEILNGVSSRNAEAVLLAHQRAAAALTLYPDALRGTDDAEKVAEAGRRWQFQTLEAGQNPEVAAARIAALNDPEQREANEALRESKEVKDTLKKIDAAFVEKQMAHWLSSVPVAGRFIGAAINPSLGDTPHMESLGVQDFRDLVEEGMVLEGGDKRAAIDWATQQFQRSWQVSEFYRGGDEFLVKFPAEVINRPVNGSWEYLHSQAIEALREEGITDYQSYWFEHVVDPRTGRDVTMAEMRAGRVPAMVLKVRDMAGKEQFVPVAFRGDPDRAQAEHLADLAVEQDRESSVKAARVNFKQRQRAYQEALSDFDNPNRQQAVEDAYRQLEASRDLFAETVDRARTERRQEQLSDRPADDLAPRTPPLDAVRQQSEEIKREKGL